MDSCSSQHEEEDSRPILALIRQDYLRAKPPQQITQLRNLFHNLLREEQEIPSNSSIRETSQKNVTAAAAGDEELLGMDELAKGLGEVGDKASLGRLPPRPGDDDDDNNTNTIITGQDQKDWCSNAVSTSGQVSAPVRNPHTILINLYDGTLGRRERLGGQDISEDFLQPPIQYRISFAKYVIKQLEEYSCVGNWAQSVPQGSHEEDETLLEKWYDGLELLSSRQVLSEPFYRLYQIKVPHSHPHDEEQEEVVKMFENETSFVADGTTGLVTWEASLEFLNWFIEEGECRLKLENETRWIMELGCGCGFLAVAMTKCCTGLDQYIATDLSLSALEKAKENLDANYFKNPWLKSKVRFERVDWQEETRESFTQLVDGMTNIYGADTGILLGADIIFDPAIVPDLVELISVFVNGKSGKAILSCTIRNEATTELLITQLGSAGLSTNVCGKWKNGIIIKVGSI